MNTANLQLEGLLVALAELSRLLVQAGAVSQEAIEEALQKAEQAVHADEARTRQLSDSQVDAMLFPIRYLALAGKAGGETQSFADLAAEIGRLKPDRVP
ncbi:hypothetical protein [Bosea sp. RCC_152_1]|uniref:hypothetical protein n=1 Tax=Bosea sp. RCC_152_1 TaxID=3239228 RepID=UPI003523149B